jgi:hypothetical protein
MSAEPLSKELESLGFRLSLGIQEVDEHLTPQEIEMLESIAIRYAGRRAIADMLETEKGQSR